MGDMGDLYRDWDGDKKAKKESNLQDSLATLRARGHSYTQLSDSHFRVGGYDFWPSTGKWKRVGAKAGGRGILGLLVKLEPKKRKT